MRIINKHIVVGPRSLLARIQFLFKKFSSFPNWEEDALLPCVMGK